MPKKKLKYLVLDCETATFPFADELAQGDGERKRKIAIAKPLIYDIGWQLIDRQGNVYSRKQYLVSEVFSVPSIFNTAYYAEKRPIYLEMLSKGEIDIKTWNDIIKIFMIDFSECDFIGAFNSMFDFVKAIPFTDLYISKLYSPNYYKWEAIQKNFASKIMLEKRKIEGKEKDFSVFCFREIEKPLFDIWGMCCETLLNRDKYKKFCLDFDMLTESGDFFKTSAESSYRYLIQNFNFEEAHTALADVEIESKILSKILMRQAVKQGIKFFPFRLLGRTIDFLETARGIEEKHFDSVIVRIEKRVPHHKEYQEMTPYEKGVYNRYNKLLNMKAERF